MQVNYQGFTSSTQPSGMVWNGAQWVSSGNVQQSGQYSNYTHAQQQPQPSTNPSDQVKYRFYYKQAQEFRQAAVSPVVSPSDKEEWLRKSKWSEYYSGQAYYGKPGVPDIQTTVPPAPGVSTAATQQQQQVASSRSMHDIPDSLKRYVQAMLRQCKTDAEKKVAQDMVQRVIQNAVKTSTLWSTNWDERIPESDPASAAEKQSVPFPVPPQPISSIPPPPPPPKGPSVAQTASILPRSHASNLSQSNGAASSPNQAWSVTANDSYYCPVDKVTARDSYYGPTDVSLSSSPKKKKQKKVLAVVKTAVIGFDIASDTMAARANRFSTDLGKGKKKNRSVEQEVGRFMGMGVVGGHSSSKMMDQSEYEKMTVKGTCQTLEKGYLRLTAPPKAELVRPEPVLQKHLHNLKKLWAKKKRDYAWMCSQLKALRQDLTVQRINNPLTVDVYETHARIALEESDLNEYNQCQTQLKELYAKLQKEGDPKGLKNLCEFLAYRLIYFVFLTLNKKYEGGSSDLLNMMLSLTTEQKLDRCIGHALKVRVAVAECNYHMFFQLYQNSPKMSGFLLDHMLHPVRFASLQRIVKAFRPTVPIGYVLKNLGIDVNDHEEMGEGIEWIKSCGCVLEGEGDLNSKDTVLCESTLKLKNSLI